MLAGYCLKVWSIALLSLITGINMFKNSTENAILTNPIFLWYSCRRNSSYQSKAETDNAMEDSTAFKILKDCLSSPAQGFCM